MHIHILGICGTFMGGVAVLARAAGHTVSGSDQNVYPPMSTQLEQQGIDLCEGYNPASLPAGVDQVVIGNALSRGNPMVEHVLNKNIPYTSGPQWLSENVLNGRWVLAVAGTHGKTTTSSMLAWILEYAGLDPGFLIGGVPANFGVSARLGRAPFFVVEADEYDTAFFDKRSKFVHYRPRTCILNNLEFDHADIFDDLAAIQKQFHHLIRTVPAEGKLIVNGDDARLHEVLEAGCWSQQESFSDNGNAWSIRNVSEDGSAFDVYSENRHAGSIHWQLHGAHNRHNALAAIAAARHAGVPVKEACEALAAFSGIRRRLELIGDIGGVRVYDDFAHHPTAIMETLKAAQEIAAGKRIIAILEPRSNTMRMGVHRQELMGSLQGADQIYLYEPANIDWDMREIACHSEKPATVFDDTQQLIDAVCEQAQAGDCVIIMSNGGFEGLHTRLVEALEAAGQVF